MFRHHRLGILTQNLVSKTCWNIYNHKSRSGFCPQAILLSIDTALPLSVVLHCASLYQENILPSMELIQCPVEPCTTLSVPTEFQSLRNCWHLCLGGWCQLLHFCAQWSSVSGCPQNDTLVQWYVSCYLTIWISLRNLAELGNDTITSNKVKIFFEF